MSAAERFVGSMNREKVEGVLVFRPGDGADPYEASLPEVFGYGRLWQVTPAETPQDEGPLRLELGHPPRTRREHGPVGHALALTLGKHDLNVLCEERGRHGSVERS